MRNTRDEKRSLQSSRGFTLIELLVVVAIIAVLISILLPALGQAREIAKKAVCGSNMGQVAKAIYLYSQDNQSWLPAYESYTAATWYDKTGSAFGNYIQNTGGIAKLVKRPANVATTNTAIVNSYAKSSASYLQNCDALFCPGDTTYAPLRIRNPIDTHGWAPYDTTYSMTNDFQFNAMGYWYMYVSEDERAMGYTPATTSAFYQGFKRYKVDAEDAVRKTIFTDLGHCPQFGTIYKMSHNNGGWNTLYADGHVKFHQLPDVYSYAISVFPYASGRSLFQYFDQHP